MSIRKQPEPAKDGKVGHSVAAQTVCTVDTTGHLTPWAA